MKQKKDERLVQVETEKGRRRSSNLSRWSETPFLRRSCKIGASRMKMPVPNHESGCAISDGVRVSILVDQSKHDVLQSLRQAFCGFLQGALLLHFASGVAGAYHTFALLKAD